MKLTINGTFFGTSGYANHTRNLANALNEQGVDVRIECQKPQGWEAGVNDAELRMLTKEPSSDRAMLCISTPQHWRVPLSTKPAHFVGFLVWEGTHIPQAWIEHLADDRVDQVWVPSEHVKDAVIRTYNEHGGVETSEAYDPLGICSKLRVVPHGFDPSVFRPAQEPPEQPFTFIINKGWRGGWKDRGGVQYAIKAYHDEFGEEEEVKLFVKINPAYIQTHDHTTWLQNEMEQLGIKRGEGPRIELTTQPVSNEQIARFYQEAHVFINAARAEGFGLTGLEAKACGLPTIQTGFGGHLDYLDPEVDIELDYTLSPVKHDITYEEAEWAVPDITQLQRCMRQMIEEYESRRAAAIKDVERLNNEWTWASTAKKALECLRSLK